MHHEVRLVVKMMTPYKYVNVDLLCILVYFCLFFPNNLCTLPKIIYLTDFSASERSDIGLMSKICYVFF